MKNSTSKPLVRWLFEEDAARLALIEPWCVAGAKTLHRWMRKHFFRKDTANTNGLDGVLIETLAEGLLNDLQTLLARTLEMEFQISRLQGEITQSDPAEEFNQFLRLLQSPERNQLFWEEYTVLEQRSKNLIRSWVRSTAEMLSHLQNDFHEISARFGIRGNDRLLGVDRIAGDRHHHGRRVQILRFASGQRLVYKPRNLDAEIAFYEITDWLGEAGFSLPLRRPVALGRSDHGWVEFIEEQECPDESSLQRLHRRQGALLAVLHLLDATDITVENLIRAGEHPVVIDAEAICSPFYVATSGRNHPEKPHALSQSVMRVGMLPQKAWQTASGLEVDVSAMAGADAGEYHESVIDGFHEASQLVLNRKNDWFKSGGILDRLGRVRARLIARPTRAYGMLLHESTHPDMMRTPDTQRNLMQVLAGSNAPNEISEKFIRSEVAALCRDDIPVFEVEVQSGWVHSCSESHLVRLEPSPLACVRSRLDHWNHETIHRECQVIEMALKADGCDRERAARKPHRLSPCMSSDPVDLLVSTSIGIADRLCSRRYDSDWLDLTLAADRARWCVSNIDTDLYSGRCGIALSLATVAQVSGLDRFADVAQDVMLPLRRQPEGSQKGQVGAFSGIAGEIYATVHLATLLQDASWLDHANDRLNRLAELIPLDNQLDLIAGSAGCLAVLESVGNHLSPDLVERCKAECAFCLMGSAESSDRGIHWPLASFENGAMTGLAHGNAGIAMALSHVSTMAHGAVHDHVVQGIEFEQTHFNDMDGTWKDLRPNTESCMTAWCHGAPGIGISRLQLLKKLDRPELDRQIKHAVAATLRRGFGDSHCLCHGDLGNLDFLTMVSKHNSEFISPAQTLQLASQIAHSVRVHGPRCGTPANIETPGLMTGLAGIAWGLIRASAPEQVPSILSLDPPKNVEITHPTSVTATHF